MKALWFTALSLLSTAALAGGTNAVRVPEPDMWALIGIAAVALGVARFIRRK